MMRWIYACFPFMYWGRSLNKETFTSDLIAGFTGAVIVLPQGVAYAVIAGLPPEYGLYTAIVTPVIAALFGSSYHLISGPTAAISIVMMSVATNIGNLDDGQFIATVLIITLLAGLVQLVLGLLKLGTLVNFISHTVVIGFTAGAAVLIAGSQLQYLIGVQLPGGLSFVESLSQLFSQIDATNFYSLSTGIITLATALGVRHCNKHWPHLLIGMFVGSLYCFVLNGAEHGVILVGALPGTLPPFSIPNLTLGNFGTLISAATAVAILGLIEAVSIARAISIRSHQQIDGNQEIIGQGLSNIIGSFFSCYAGSGSFSRSGANFDAGAKSPLAAIFAAIILALIVVLAPNVTAYLPFPAMAGAILLIAWNLIDFHHIKQLILVTKNEAIILIVTFLATLLTHLEYAIYIGIFLSLAMYLKRTSKPVVVDVAPRSDHPERKIRNINRYNLNECPQLKIIRIDGSLYFGAIEHIQKKIRELSHKGSDIKFMLIICKGINFVDIAGAQMLLQETQRLKRYNGQLILSSFKGPALDELKKMGYIEKMGEDAFYDSPNIALKTIIPQLNQNRCQNCHTRIFNECPAQQAKEDND